MTHNSAYNPTNNHNPANDTLTAVQGFRVGHYTDAAGGTGCTVIECPAGGAVASASFFGPSPGTREGVLLAPEKRVERVHALLLTGGSAFGLAAADGVMRELRARGVGVETPFARVPIVPAAVIYDLGVGDAEAAPNAEAGAQALRAAASGPVPEGRVGAGTGATVSKWRGAAGTRAGGVGSAYLSRMGPNGVRVEVGVLAVVNPLGDVLDAAGQPMLEPKQEAAQVAGGQAAGEQAAGMQAQVPETGVQNTTLLAVCVAHPLTKAECRRLADTAGAALARVVAPSHTDWDGDRTFVLSSGVNEHAASARAEPFLLAALTQEAVAEAVRRGVAAGQRG